MIKEVEEFVSLTIEKMETYFAMEPDSPRRKNMRCYLPFAHKHA